MARLNNAEVISPRLFKVDTSKTNYWSEWFDINGQAVFAATAFETTLVEYLTHFADDTLYFKTDDYLRRESIVYAVNATTGQLKWDLKIKKGIASLPTIANGSLYVGAGSGLFYALDPLAKKVKWGSSSGDRSIVVTSRSRDGSVFSGATTASSMPWTSRMVRPGGSSNGRAAHR